MAEESGPILPWRYLQVWLLAVVVSNVNPETGDKMKLQMKKLSLLCCLVASIVGKNLHAV